METTLVRAVIGLTWRADIRKQDCSVCHTQANENSDVSIEIREQAFGVVVKTPVSRTPTVAQRLGYESQVTS